MLFEGRALGQLQRDLLPLLSGKARTVTATGDTRIILCGIAQTSQLKEWTMRNVVCIGYLPLIPCQGSTIGLTTGMVPLITRILCVTAAQRMVTIAAILAAAREKAADVI